MASTSVKCWRRSLSLFLSVSLSPSLCVVFQASCSAAIALHIYRPTDCLVSHPAGSSYDYCFKVQLYTAATGRTGRLKTLVQRNGVWGSNRLSTHTIVNHMELFVGITIFSPQGSTHGMSSS